MENNMDNLTPKQIQELDQETARYADLILPPLKRLYDGMIESGIPSQVVSQTIAKTTSDLFMSFIGIKRE